MEGGGGDPSSFAAKKPSRPLPAFVRWPSSFPSLFQVREVRERVKLRERRDEQLPVIILMGRLCPPPRLETNRDDSAKERPSRQGEWASQFPVSLVFCLTGVSEMGRAVEQKRCKRRAKYVTRI